MAWRGASDRRTFVFLGMVTEMLGFGRLRRLTVETEERSMPTRLPCVSSAVVMVDNDGVDFDLYMTD